ncbi:unnamed protein product [Heligmosomoides polygyrus]|uniref:Uncharacterized protein n=1 Tax=Heligmosomoides polygyrus TaxID=6339 RepID=A0A183FDB2_HELPZ|nr:unnamed protein product [Heligmosomoides polygyrus]
MRELLGAGRGDRERGGRGGVMVRGRTTETSSWRLSLRDESNVVRLTRWRRRLAPVDARRARNRPSPAATTTPSRQLIGSRFSSNDERSDGIWRWRRD